MKHCDKINILQNFIVKPIMKPNEVSSSEKNSYKRQTSSMYLLDEIPVFSDTDDEEEYTKQFLNDFNLTVVPRTPKNRDAEIQCDIPIESDIMNLIKVCSELNINIHSDLVELINICKVLAEKYYKKESINESSKMTRSDYVQTQVLDDQFPVEVEAVPDRQPDISSTGMSPSRLGCVDSINKSIHSKINKPSDTKLSQKKKRKNLQDVTPRHSTRLKFPRKWNKDFSMVIEDKKEMLQRQTINPDEKLLKNKVPTKIQKDPIFKKPKQLPKKLQQKGQGSTFQNVLGTLDDGLKELVRNSEFTKDQNMYQNYPPAVIKRLARSWINPNKSLDYELMVHTNHKMSPIYASLQHTNKLRRLYSPTEWLSSEDFEKSCPSITNPIRSIFR